MNRKDKIAENINELLPDSSSLIGTDGIEARQAMVDKMATNIHQKKSAKEIARARLAIKAEQEAELARQAVQSYKEKKEQAKEEAL